VDEGAGTGWAIAIGVNGQKKPEKMVRMEKKRFMNFKR
jgi:hypothetical protein